MRKSAMRQGPVAELVNPGSATKEIEKTSQRQTPGSYDDQRSSKAPRMEARNHDLGDEPTGKDPEMRPEMGTEKTVLPSVQAKCTRSTGSFSCFPPEILNMIVEMVTYPSVPKALSFYPQDLQKDTASLSRLSKTCKAFHDLAIPQLHKRICLSVDGHLDVIRFIRKIEPFLAVEQRKQLNHEHPYEVQQRDFLDGLDPKKKPEIAGCVRQAIFDMSDETRSNRTVVRWYVEELVQSVCNLEVFVTAILSEPMIERLAAKTQLKALRLQLDDSIQSNARRLGMIKGLNHLSLYLSNWYRWAHNTPTPLLWGSRSTLRSLELNKDLFRDMYKGCSEKPGETAGASNQRHDFTALESFSLSDACIDEEEIDALARAIDFAALYELRLGENNYEIGMLYRHLIDAFCARRRSSDVGIRLRRLSLNLAPQAVSKLDRWMTEPRGEELGIAFISCFDTLTNLTICDAGILWSDLPYPELKDDLFRGILMHENLTSLIFMDAGNQLTVTGNQSTITTAKLDAQIVTRFVLNLFHLRGFCFYVDPTQLREIGAALSLGRNLEAIELRFHSKHLHEERREKEALECLRHVLLPSLERESYSDPDGYRWEDHSKVNRVAINSMVWEVGSSLARAMQGQKEADKIETASDPKRRVFYRDVDMEPPFEPFLAYDSRICTPRTINRMRKRVNMCEWVDKVAKDVV